MHEQAPTLEATRRERTGSRYAERARRAGQLPAVVYGHKQDPVAISLDAHATLAHLRKGEKVFELSMDGQSQHVLLKALGYDHLGDNIIHADFARVDLNERVRTHAHLVFVGEAVGLRKAGTTLVRRITELELECTVSNLPDKIEVDISKLDTGDAIHASDIELPFDTMKLLTDPETVVVRVSEVAAEEDDTGEAGEVGAEAAPAVIGEKKDAEGGDK